MGTPGVRTRVGLGEVGVKGVWESRRTSRTDSGVLDLGSSDVRVRQGLKGCLARKEDPKTCEKTTERTSRVDDRYDTLDPTVERPFLLT